MALSCGRGGEVPYPHQVVDGRGEGEIPVHPGQPSVAHLSRHAHCLQPAEDLLDPFSQPLAHSVSEVPGRTTIDGAVADLLSHVRRHVMLPQFLHEPLHVVALVSAAGRAQLDRDERVMRERWIDASKTLAGWEGQPFPPHVGKLLVTNWFRGTEPSAKDSRVLTLDDLKDMKPAGSVRALIEQVQAVPEPRLVPRYQHRIELLGHTFIHYAADASPVGEVKNSRCSIVWIRRPRKLAVGRRWTEP
jgi:hypothetical protein